MAEDQSKTVDSHPLRIHFVDDDSYTWFGQLLVPYTGSQREYPSNDAFDFHLSQSRIRIEIALGRLVSKFCIL